MEKIKSTIILADTILGMDKKLFVFIAIVCAILAVVLTVFYLSVVFVDKNQSKIIERLGKYRKTLNRGWNFVVPIFDKAVATIDTSETVFSSSKEISFIGRNNEIFKAFYDVSYFVFNASDFYYNTKLSFEIIENECSQIVISFFNNNPKFDVKDVFECDKTAILLRLNEMM